MGVVLRLQQGVVNQRKKLAEEERLLMAARLVEVQRAEEAAMEAKKKLARERKEQMDALKEQRRKQMVSRLGHKREQ